MAKDSGPGQTSTQAVLTPARPALRRALAEAARNARRVADAFGVPVPSVPSVPSDKAKGR